MPCRTKLWTRLITLKSLTNSIRWLSIAAEKQPHSFVTYTHDAWNRLVKIEVGSDTRAQKKKVSG